MNFTKQDVEDLKKLAIADPMLGAWINHWLEWRTEKARPAQVCLLHEQPEKFGQIWVSGRGSGKSRTASEETFAYAMLRPKSRQIVVAPTFSSARGICFPAGTMISTENGDIPIELVKKGTLVWTRQGLKRVEKSGKTGDKSVISLLHSEGVLTGTPDHPIWDDKLKDFRPLVTFSEGDIIAFCKGEELWGKKSDGQERTIKITNISNSTDRDLFAIQNQRNLKEGNTSQDIGVEKISTITERSGFFITVRSQKDGTFTIKMGTTLTMCWRTLNACRHKFIGWNMKLKLLLEGTEKKISKFLKKHKSLLANGGKQKKEKNGLKNWLSLQVSELKAEGDLQAYGRKLKINAFSAKNLLLADIQEAPFIVRIYVALRTLIKEGRMVCSPVNQQKDISGCTVENAEKSSLDSFKRINRLIVQQSVVTGLNMSKSGCVPVFNLQVEDCPEFFANGVLVHNCTEGESGLLSISPNGVGSNSCITKYNRSIGEIEFYNGSQIDLVSAEEPERLRGVQCHRAYIDELCAIGNGDDDLIRRMWDMLIFGLRLPPRPTIIITTTPKPLPFLRELVKRPDFIVTRESTYANAKNLGFSFMQEIKKYEGTKLGRQEIHGEIVDLEAAGIFKREWFKLWPAGKAFPVFQYVVASYDTAYTEKDTGSYSACSVWGIFKEPSRGDWHVLLLDCWRDHIGYPELRKKMMENWKTSYGEPDPSLVEYSRMSMNPRPIAGKKPDIMLIEKKASGQSLLQDLRNEGINCWDYNPGREDKTMRAHMVSPMVAGGKVWIPESYKEPGKEIGWAVPFLDEIVGNNPSEDTYDYGDTFSSALSLLRDESWLGMPLRDPDDLEDLEAAEFYEKNNQNPYSN